MDRIEQMPVLPHRDADGHKGTFGTVSVIGGCAGGGSVMLGAPLLAGVAALRAGCGLVRVLAPAPLCVLMLAREPTLIGHPLAVDGTGEVVSHEAAGVIDEVSARTACFVVGPGLGSGESARAMSLRVVQQEGVACVVDADAVNALSRVPELFRDFRAPAVLTPHPGEFERLASSLGVRAPLGTDGERESSCASMARRLGCVVVLKGARTVVSDGLRTWVSSHAVPALATAGTGDVLSGLVAGLIAQRSRVVLAAPLGIFDLACLGVEAHARAGLAWSRETRASGGMLASDLLSLIPQAVESLRQRDETPF